MVLLMIVLGALCGFAALTITKRLIRRRAGEASNNTIISFKITPYLWCVLFAAAFTGLYFITGTHYDKAEYMAVFTLCMCIGAVDMTIKKIPNSLLFGLFCSKIIFLALRWDFEDVKKSLIGFAAAAVIFTIPAFLKLNVGAGDIKLAAVTGFYLGLGGFLQAMIIMAVLISFYGIWLLISKKGGFKTKTAMGPYLALGLIITLVFPLIL